MKRGLIALAVAGAFAAPAAMAEVTLSGAINMGIQLGKSSSDTAGNPGLTTNQLHPSYSHMDLESVDDIGGGNKVVMHYQMDISGTSSANPGRAGGAIGNRNSFLGLTGQWGAFKVGTNENVYEKWMYTADPLDGAVGPGGNLNLLGTPGAATVFEVGQAGCGPTATTGCVGFYRRAEQEIWYESPNWSGFSFEVDYTLSAFKTQTTDPKIVSIGGKFQPDGMPFYVDLAYEKHDDMFGANKIVGFAGGTSSSDNAVQIGGGYTIGDLGLHLRYEQLKYKTDGSASAVNEYKRTAYWLAAKYNLPSGYVGGEIGVAQKGKTNVGTATNTGAKMLGVGYFHNLSKQSQLQFIFARTNNEDAATYVQIGAPLAGAGTTNQVFDVRLKHVY
ncbi:MAG: porin [Betaproteobacteria bacterium]|nr:porin [Betaproteobacteria bacterium]